MKGHKVIAVGYEDGDIKLFNVNNSQYLWETKLKDGVCSVDFVKDILRVGTLLGAFSIDVYSGKITELKVIMNDMNLFHVINIYFFYN